jgi:hypothetical protein
MRRHLTLEEVAYTAATVLYGVNILIIGDSLLQCEGLGTWQHPAYKSKIHAWLSKFRTVVAV